MLHPDYPHLEAFWARWADAPLEHQQAALRAACGRGDGTWTAPGPGHGHTTATHRHEVALFQVFAIGETAEEATANWFRAAAYLVPAIRAELTGTAA